MCHTYRKRKLSAKTLAADATAAIALACLLALSLSGDTPDWLWFACFPLACLFPALAYRHNRARTESLLIFSCFFFGFQLLLHLGPFIMARGTTLNLAGVATVMAALPLFVKTAVSRS